MSLNGLFPKAITHEYNSTNVTRHRITSYNVCYTKLLRFLKDRKWKKYVFVFHVGIISLITLIVGLFVIKDPKSFDDKIDENVLFV